MGANADVIRRFVDAFNSHDADAIAACYAESARIIYPQRPLQSPQEHSEGERGMFEAIPNYHIEITALLEADDDHVVLELTMEGTQRADLGGRSFTITGAYVFKVGGGLIVEERAYPDLAGLRKQLSPPR